MKTLKQLSLDIDNLLRENPQFGDLPVIYSSDDEGNSYKKVHQDVTPAMAIDVKEWELELVGFLGNNKNDYEEEENQDLIEVKDINCICIN